MTVPVGDHKVIDQHSYLIHSWSKGIFSEGIFQMLTKKELPGEIIVLVKTVVGVIRLRFDNLSGSRPQSQLIITRLIMPLLHHSATLL